MSTCFYITVTHPLSKPLTRSDLLSLTWESWSPSKSRCHRLISTSPCSTATYRTSKSQQFQRTNSRRTRSSLVESWRRLRSSMQGQATARSKYCRPCTWTRAISNTTTETTRRTNNYRAVGAQNDQTEAYTKKLEKQEASAPKITEVSLLTWVLAARSISLTPSKCRAFQLRCSLEASQVPHCHPSEEARDTQWSVSSSSINAPVSWSRIWKVLSLTSRLSLKSHSSTLSTSRNGQIRHWAARLAIKNLHVAKMCSRTESTAYSSRKTLGLLEQMHWTLIRSIASTGCPKWSIFKTTAHGALWT